MLQKRTTSGSEEVSLSWALRRRPWSTCPGIAATRQLLLKVDSVSMLNMHGSKTSDVRGPAKQKRPLFNFRNSSKISDMMSLNFLFSSGSVLILSEFAFFYPTSHSEVGAVQDVDHEALDSPAMGFVEQRRDFHVLGSELFQVRLVSPSSSSPPCIRAPRRPLQVWICVPCFA